MNQDEKLSHFGWCWKKTIENFTKENINFHIEGEHKEYYQKLIEIDNSTLSEAALETLAIIAYNEPITRVKVDEIRGVSSSHIVSRLLAKELISNLEKD
jgi:segregation and condensation protein B